jgi:fibronectin-binding autotransporter adhesin
LVGGSQQLTLGGSGTLTLVSRTGTAVSTYAKIMGGSSATFTNGASHSILGNGMLGDVTFTSITNNGLIRSTGTNAVPLTINPSSNGSITNAGRIVADSTGGVFLGSDTAARTLSSTGLLEARAGSSLTIGTFTTGTIDGDVRGGGTVQATNLSLASTASLTPGDSVVVSGGGASSLGTLSLRGNLSLGSDTALNFQLGADTAAGVTYDTVTLMGTGDLKLDGKLNVAALSGFDNGTYRLFTIPGTMTYTAGDLQFGNLPGGHEYSLDVQPQYVNLIVVPEPATVATAMLCAGGAVLIRRRSR